MTVRAKDASRAAKATKSVAVIGAGTMGFGIAVASARGGMPTVLIDMSQERLDKAAADARTFFAKSLDKRKISESEHNAAIANLTTDTNLAAAASVDLVIEAIFEDPETKGALIRDLDTICAPDTIIASNTSTLSITSIAAHSHNPERVVGLHFCLPAQLMRLVEATRGLQTSAEVFDRAWQFCLEIGQHPIETKDTPGFILNHFAIPMHNRAIRMVDAGIATAVDIDRAIKTACGHAMGPLELLDLVGLDTQQRLCETFYALTHDPELSCPNLVHRMVAAGWVGKKAGKGFYDYSDARAFGA